MTLGDKSLLDKDLKQDFADAGASHVLAVSGLHVGVVFLICNFFFSLFIRGNFIKRRFFRSLLVVSFLWFYALIAGFSSSVVRASIMFSFMQMGFLFQRRLYVFATLFASAFVMLVFNPDYLFDVSFQLSYLALLSILVFQPRIYALLSISSLLDAKIPSFCVWILEKVWALTSVSLAAQLGTAPLTIFYFHQFPLYFWLSGLIVIPLSAVIIYLAFAYFFLSWIPFVSSAIIWLLMHTASLMNSAVSIVAALPFSTISSVNFGPVELVLAYLSILIFLLYLAKRYYFQLVLSLACFLLVFVVSIARYLTNGEQSGLVVCNVSGRSIVNVFSPQSNRLCTNDSVKAVSTLHTFWINHYCPTLQIDSSRMFCVNGKTVFIVDRNISKLDKPVKPFMVDYLIVSSNVKIPIKDLHAFFNFKELIVDSSCSSYVCQWWKQNYRMAYIVRTDGDYIKYLD